MRTPPVLYKMKKKGGRDMQNDSIDNIRLDINKKSERAAIYLRIGDTVSRTVHCTLARAGKVVSLQNAVVASILIKKPNGYESDNSVVIVGDELQYTWRTSDVSAEGENICQFVVTFDDGATLATPEFSMYAYKKIVDQKTEKSFNEYTTIQQQVAMTKQFADSAKIASEKAADAEKSVSEAQRILQQLITTAVCNITMNGETLQKDQEGSVNLGNVLTGGEQTITSSEDGAINVYTFSDGSTITIKNGDTGAPGKDGADGDAGTNAGFGTPTATINAETGTPAVTVTASGPDTAKVFNFAFENLKGEKGDTGAPGKDGATADIATEKRDGLMSKEDKKLLNTLAEAIKKSGYPIG